tara:strand:- start:26 stop:577 length:552 start_codon:yes stop_codon:yes gene_type:complete
MEEVLLLNRDGNPLNLWPLSTISWKQAIKALYLEKVKVLRSYNDWICHSQNISLKVPSVVIMSNFHYRRGKVNFSRRNIFLRDRFHCQYCQRSFPSEDLTIDHVIPKSMGGSMLWKNVVTACQNCNFRKGSKIVIPLKKPFEPNYWEMESIAKTLHIQIPDYSWQEFLRWPKHLVKINISKVA